jgi:multidrug efflux pump subunit AcrB
MKKLVKAFVKYPFYANMIATLVVIIGVWFAFTMKRSFFPQTSPKFITVSVFYPGASPTEMDEGVTSIVEQKLKGIVGIEKVNSTSQENSSRIRIKIIEDYDIDEIVQDVKNAVDGITNFPSGAERPFVYKQRATSPVASYSLAGDVSLMKMKEYGDKIRDDFYAAGITQFSIGGLSSIEIAIEVSEETLNRYNLSFSEIANAVRGTNRDVSGGIIRNNYEEMMIRVRARTTEPEKIKNIIVRANPDGSYLRVKDIGTVNLQFDETPTESTQNGKKNLFIQIQKLNSEDLVERTEWLRNYVEEFNETHTDVQLDRAIEFYEMLKGRLVLLLKNGAVGILLVVLALTMFLSFRLSLWVSFGIPFSFCAMYIVGHFYGITVNMISLMGMILVIGILVDDGIVIAENIYAHFEKGKKPRQAAVDGVFEVLPAVTSSVLTTIVVFGTLMINMKGDMEFLVEACFVVIAALAFSLVEAFFILPVHVGNKKVLSHSGNGKLAQIRRKLDKGIFYVRDRLYGKLLRNIINNRGVYFVVPICLIVITGGLMGGGFIKSTVFPSIPFDQIQINLQMTPGVGKAETLKILKKIEKDIWTVNNRLTKDVLEPRYEDAKNDFWSNFSEPVKESPYISSVYTWLNSSNSGGLYVQFRNIDYDTVSSAMIQRMVVKQIGEVPEAEKLIIGSGRWGKPVSIGLAGYDYKQLEEAKKDLKAELADMVDLTSIEDDNTPGAKEIQLKMKDKAYFLGLDQNFIASQVRDAFYGHQIQKLQKGKDEVRVWVRYPKKDRMQIGQIDDMKIKVGANQYPVSELVDYDIARGPGVITHREGIREINVSADFKDVTAPSGPIIEKIKKDILPKLSAKYKNVKFIPRGQQEEGGKRTNDFAMSLGIGLLLVLVIIMINFKSLLQSLIVLAMIPLGWMSALWGHGIEGIPVSLLSSWGLVALAGIIINDSIVFLAKYNSLVLEGYKVKEAVYKAGISRFRAIMLTSITTVLGLYPIIWEESFQAQFLKPMTIALAYGVLFGTMFILIFFPVAILILNDLKYFFHNLLPGKSYTREEVTTVIKDSKRKVD